MSALRSPSGVKPTWPEVTANAVHEPKGDLALNVVHIGPFAYLEGYEGCPQHDGHSPRVHITMFSLDPPQKRSRHRDPRYKSVGRIVLMPPNQTHQIAKQAAMEVLIAAAIAVAILPTGASAQVPQVFKEDPNIELGGCQGQCRYPYSYDYDEDCVDQCMAKFDPQNYPPPNSQPTEPEPPPPRN